MKRNLHAGGHLNGGLSLNILTEDELEEIHLATLELLEDTGVVMECDEALDRFEDAGARVGREAKTVRIDASGEGEVTAGDIISDDGKCEVSFDIGEGQAIMSSYIRQIYKKKFIYSDEIRLYRGERVSISSVKDSKIYIDGELITMSEPELKIETFSQKVRIFFKPDIQNQ